MSYWNFIIPPIVFLLSFFILVKIFRKKKIERKTVIQKISPFGNFGAVSESLGRLGPRLVGKSGGFLDFFEKSVVGFFSRIQKISQSLFRHVRNVFTRNRKRERIFEKKNFSKKDFLEKHDNVKMRENSYSGENENAVSFGDKKKTTEDSSQEEDIIARPMVSDMTRPSNTKSRILSKNDYEEALIGRIALNPRDIAAYEALGDFYIDQRNFEDALECYKQVIKLDPQHRGTKVRIRRLERVLAHDQFLN